LPFPSGASRHYAGSERSRLPTDLSAGERWRETGLVFTTSVGTKMLAGNSAGTSAAPWLWYQVSTHRSGRPENYDTRLSRYFSDAGVPLEKISQLVGRSGTTVTELVYRHQLRPVIQTGAIVMDQLFSGNRRQAD
jgi:hypothetical protein